MTTPTRAGAPANALQPAVTIYTSDDCHWCGKAKNYLAQRGVPFQEIDVVADPAAGEAVIRMTGQHGVPVITVGSTVIVGFQRRKRDAALALGPPDAATEAALPIAQDTLAALVAQRRIVWTAAQDAEATRLSTMVDPETLCAYLSHSLDGSPATCTHTFEHLTAYLAATPPHGTDTTGVIALLESLGITCDCGYAINVCMR